MNSILKHVKVMLICLLAIPLLLACGGGGGDAPAPATGSGSTSGDTTNKFQVNTLASTIVTPLDGGTVKVLDSGELNGVSVTVPPGAVSQNTTIEIGEVIDPPELGGIDLFFTNDAGLHYLNEFTQELNERSSDSFYHPLHYAMAWMASQPKGSGPMLHFEPGGTQFNLPVTIEIPLSSIGVTPEVDPSTIGIALSRESGNGSVNWDLIGPVTVTPTTLAVQVEHFSALQIIRHTILALVAPLVYKNMTLPDVPIFTDSLVQKIVCSGIEPKLDTNRIPHPIDLLLYLANPLHADSTSSLSLDSYWVLARKVPDPISDLTSYNKRLVELGLRNGNETTLENIVRYSSINSISISDLFGEAYKLAKGDYFQAMLLCHNVLRGHRYGGDGSSNNPYWGNRHDQSIQANMQSILGYGDATGHRYHLFGMMLYGFIQSGVWKPAVPLINDQTTSDIYRELTVFFEEGIVSGDLLTEPEEAAIDKEGFNTGRDFFTQVFNKSISEIKNDPNFTLDACDELDVKISADPAATFVNETVYFNSIITGGEAPYVYYWEFGDGGTSEVKK